MTFENPTDLPSVAGVYALSTYPPEIVRRLRAGRIVVVSDTKSDPATAPFYVAVFEPLFVQSFVTVPLLRRGHSVAALGAAPTIAQ
jgi:GAF domain-containing protein